VSERVIIFSEHNQERIFPANTSDELASACLLILRERFNNKAWGYEPKFVGLSDEEAEFLATVVNKRVNNEYKGFTANLVKEAFDWNDNFMKKE